MAWFKWYENVVTDAKIQCVARRSGQPVGFVVAVWAMLLERASAAGERGSIEGFDCESADVALQLPDGAACAIYEAFVEKGMVVDGRIAMWDERQSTRRGGSGGAARSGAERQREYRQRRKAAMEAEAEEARAARAEAAQAAGALRNVTESNVTHNASVTRNVTRNENVTRYALKDKIREEEIRGEIKEKPPIPPLQGGVAGGEAAPVAPSVPPVPPAPPASAAPPVLVAEVQAVEAPAREETRGKAKGRARGRKAVELGEAVAAYAAACAGGDAAEAARLAEALDGFVEMRLGQREPFTPRALKLTFQELDKLAGAGDVATRVAIVNQSIQRGWRGVFPIREPPAASMPAGGQGDRRRRLNPQDEDRRQMALMGLRYLEEEKNGGDGGGAAGGAAGGVCDGAKLVALAGNG